MGQRAVGRGQVSARILGDLVCTYFSRARLRRQRDTQSVERQRTAHARVPCFPLRVTRFRLSVISYAALLNIKEKYDPSRLFVTVQGPFLVAVSVHEAADGRPLLTATSSVHV